MVSRQDVKRGGSIERKNISCYWKIMGGIVTMGICSGLEDSSSVWDVPSMDESAGLSIARHGLSLSAACSGV
jgi:hypothetical protein